MPDPIADLTATEWDQVYEIVSKRLNNLPDVAGAYWWVTQSLKRDMSFTTSCRSPQRHLAVACGSVSRVAELLNLLWGHESSKEGLNRSTAEPALSLVGLHLHRA